MHIPEDNSSERRFYTALHYQVFVLISFAFIIFEIFFLALYSDKFWFKVDLSPWGIPAALLAAAFAHFLLSWQESERGCKFFALFWRGLPPVIYRLWFLTNEKSSEKGLRLGLRRVVWRAIDQVELTFFGNLLIETRSISGPARIVEKGGGPIDLNPPLVILKAPFGVVSRACQQELIRCLEKENANCQLNSRLRKQLKKNELKGTELIMLIVSGFFLLFYLDVGFSTFNFLEILKHYYLAEDAAMRANLPEAQAHFERADSLFHNPCAVSWVTHKLFESNTTKSGILQVRAETLWRMNKRQEALSDLEEARVLNPKNFRLDLDLARKLTDTAKEKEALQVIDDAISHKSDALVPRSYKIALLKGKVDARTSAYSSAALEFLHESMRDFDDKVFGEPPNWPPNVSPFLPDVWHKEDVQFVFERLLR